SLAAKRLAKRYPQRTLILAGFVVTLAGIALLLAFVRASSDSVLAFVPGLALVGLGLGGMLTPSVNVVQSSFPEALQGEISGLSRSVSNLGSSFGTAIAGTILVSVVALGSRSYAVAMIAIAVFGLVGFAAAMFLPARLKGQAGEWSRTRPGRAAGLGFEPRGRLHAQWFSRPPRSAAPAPRRSPKSSGSRRFLGLEHPEPRRHRPRRAYSRVIVAGAPYGW